MFISVLTATSTYRIRNHWAIDIKQPVRVEWAVGWIKIVVSTQGCISNAYHVIYHLMLDVVQILLIKYRQLLRKIVKGKKFM